MNIKSYADMAREQEEHDLRMQARVQMLLRRGIIDTKGNLQAHIEERERAAGESNRFNDYLHQRQ